MWLGSDHLLLVKSAWFREEYKRFYFRDIQAIVVAPCARFHVSMPILIFALLWLLPGLGMAFWPAGVAVVWGIGTLAMAATWVSISLASSCRCRLYTAVSKDDLPSLYRTWTARKFLNKVKPWIDRAQGTMDPNWMQAEASHSGPTVDLPASAELPSRVADIAVRRHTLASDLFVLSLFVAALVDSTTIHSRSSLWFRINTGLTLALLVGAIAVLIQYHRGALLQAIQKIAIAALVLMGVVFYMQSFSFSMANAGRNFAVKGRAIPLPPPVIVAHQVADGLEVLLGLIGAAVILRSSFRNEADIIKD